MQEVIGCPLFSEITNIIAFQIIAISQPPQHPWLSWVYVIAINPSGCCLINIKIQLGKDSIKQMAVKR